MIRFTHDGVPFTVHVASRFLRLFGKKGLTFRSHVFLAHRAGEVPVGYLAHEYAHVRQYRRLGTLRFLWTYLRELVTHGYGPTMPLEAEAIAFDRAYRAQFERYAAMLNGGRA